jgi:hypothetical protein
MDATDISLPGSSRYQTYPTCMGCSLRRGAWTRIVVQASRLDQEEERGWVSD